MHVVTLVSEDAGTGKSLLACHLAVQAERTTGAPAALLDTDDRKPLVGWRERRAQPSPGVVAVAPGPNGACGQAEAPAASPVGQQLERLYSEGAGLAIIDTPAPLTQALEDVLPWSDLVVIPVVPSRHRLQGLGRTVALVESFGRPFIFVVNGTDSRNTLSGAIAMALAQHGTICPVAVPKSAQLHGSLGAGASVFETAPDSDAASTVAELWTYVAKRLEMVAPAGEAPSTDERRQHARWPLDWEIEMIRDGARLPCRLADISGGGAGLRTTVDLREGEPVRLDIPLLGTYDAVVVHTRAGAAGVKFILDAERQWRLAERLAAQMTADAASPPPAVPTEPADAVWPPATPAEPGEPSAPAAKGDAPAARCVRVKLEQVMGETAAPHPSAADGTAVPAAAGERIIVLGNEKGGSGKSTVAVHLAVALLRAGRSVATVDLDPRQASFTRYMDNRRALAAAKGLALPLPSRHVTCGDDEGPEAFATLLAGLVRRHDHVIIDTPGRDGPLMRRAHAEAHMVITPLNDSFVDLDLLARLDADTLEAMGDGPYGAMVRDVQTARAAGGGRLDWVVLRNRLSAVLAHNKADMADALERLAARGGFRVAAGLTERVIYREMFLHGLTLLDLREDGVGTALTLSHVAARAELRTLLQLLLPGPLADAA